MILLSPRGNSETVTTWHYTLRSVQRGLFKAAMAAGIMLFPRRAFLHVSALYLHPEGSRASCWFSGCVWCPIEVAMRAMALLFSSVRLGVQRPIILAEIKCVLSFTATLLTTKYIRICCIELSSVTTVYAVLGVIGDFNTKQAFSQPCFANLHCNVTTEHVLTKWSKFDVEYQASDISISKSSEKAKKLVFLAS